ncbi:MAG: hypothetical protein LIP01_15055 [Tannerellaceae bacterium]|nr:hypothetical protein [Tannerellaceae bacterium]
MDNYSITKPHPLLSPYISYYWTFQCSGNREKIQRVIPTGCMQLIIHFTDKLYSGTRNSWQPRAFLGGQIVGYEDLNLHSDIDILTIVFHPYGAKAFFPFLCLNYMTQPLVCVIWDYPG